MKIFAKRDRGFLDIPEDFATLESVTENGKFRYSITYKVDPIKAVQSEALTVLIHISTKPYIKKINPIFSNGTNSNENLVLNLLQKSSKQKDFVRQQKNDYILTIKSDISSKIPNNLTTKLWNANSKDNIVIKKFKEITTSPVEPLNNSNLNLPVLEMNLNKIKDNENLTTTENSQFIKNLANILLFEKGIDPADLFGLKTNSIVSAQKVTNGTTIPKPFYNNKIVKNNPKSSVLIENFLNKTSVTSQLELKNNDYINILVDKQQTFVEMTETVEIPVSSITENEFYVIFEIKNSKSSLEIESLHVNHGEKLISLSIPTIPPSVLDLGVNKPGKVLFQLKQEDQNATGINIYKKELKPTLASNDSVYNFIGKIDLQKNQGYQRYEDLAANLYPTIYRFVPVNSGGIQSSIFTSKVVKFSNAIGLTKIRTKRKPFFIGYNANIGTQGINLEINNVPSGPIAIKILKRNKTILQKEYEQVNDIINIEGNNNNSIFIEDFNVKTNRVYEYICELYYKDGTVEKSANNIIIEYQPITNNILKIELNDATIIESGQNYDATFTIKWSYISDSFELIKKLFLEQNLMSEFSEDIYNNRENLNKIFAFGVTRTNLTTNQIDSFGIIDSLQFSDLKYGKPKGILPVKAGFDYRYTVTAYLRNPETLLPKLERTVQVSQNTSYTFKPSKWLHPITLSSGNLTSVRSLLRNYSKNDFTFGKSVEIANVNLSLSDILPSISETKATKLRKDQILIQWKVLGNIGKIDHFVIILNMLEMQTVIGKAHNISNSNYFQFLDVLSNGEKGALNYYIVPIYFDYSPGTATKTNLVII